MKKSLYVIIRDDLETIAHKAVQAGHAVAQFVLDYPQDDWNNNYLIYVVVENEEKLKFWKMKVEDNAMNFSSFSEPDLGNEMTALACYSTNDKMFSKLKLLKA